MFFRGSKGVSVPRLPGLLLLRAPRGRGDRFGEAGLEGMLGARSGWVYWLGVSGTVKAYHECFYRVSVFLGFIVFFVCFLVSFLVYFFSVFVYSVFFFFFWGGYFVFVGF